MCGILGITGKNVKKYTDENLNSALNSLSKRGPDDKGIEKFDDCILGQTRLSIIDLSSGHQPMKDNQKKLTITFNGEIYNYRELKKELENRGHIFSTNSDTEVILKSYIEYGANCLEKFEGMFAFAIWDEEKKQIFIARDRFGKKPFYYAFDDENFIFASEIKALFSLGKIKGEIDFEAIDNFMRLLYIPPYKTIYKNIHTLKPAHYSIIKNINKIETYNYWKLEKKEINVSYDEAKEKIENLLEKSVKKRMLADVEVGSMLSGGIDSTLISYLAQQQTSKKLKTFSVGFENFINELPFAKEAADKIKSDHNELLMSVNIANELKKVCEYLDEPNADAAIIPTYLISKLAREKNTKVLLSGDGADELFLGYGWYIKHWNIGLKHKIENFNLFPKQFRDYLENVTYINKKERKQLWENKKFSNSDIITDYSNKEKITDLNKINLYDLNMYLPGDLLSKIDRASMMTSVETRAPFLDKELVEYVYNIPVQYKTDKKNGKIILKDILEEIMPKEFVHRRKQGFGPPINNWLEKKEMKELIHNSFIKNEADIYSFLNKKYVQKFINKFYEKREEKYGMKIWILLCLELWFKNNKKYFKKIIN